MIASKSKALKGAGTGFLGIAIAFLVIGLTTDQPGFIGVAIPFIFLAMSRQDS